MLSKLIPNTEIISKEGILHFRRWRIFESKYFRFYLHQIFESDRDTHLHSHPWHYLNFVLKGGYIEELPNGTFKEIKRFHIGTHKANHFHKLILTEHPTVSLFFAFGEYRPWGYETPEGYMDNADYRERKRKGKLPR